MKDLIARFKLLFTGQWWAFWHYNKLGFTQLTYRGTPFYFDPMIKSGTLYLLSDSFHIKLPRRKDGKPDMRFSICRTNKMLGYSLSEEVENDDKT